MDSARLAVSSIKLDWLLALALNVTKAYESGIKLFGLPCEDQMNEYKYTNINRYR